MAKLKNNKDDLFGWLDFGGSLAGVAANVLSTILTNRKNEKLAMAQRAMQRQENELAYQRGKPQNQVSQMMQAGMSKAGALNAINGGATYQPAAISSSQAQAPEIDLSTAFDGLVQIGENAKQRKMQEDMLNKQIEAAKEAQQAQFEENERQRQHDLLVKDVDTANQTQHDYLEYEKHKERLALDIANARQNWRILDKQVNYIEKQTQSLNVQIRGYELDNIRKQLENDNYPTLAKLANEKTQKEIERLILDYNQAVENHDLDKQGKELQLRWERLTQDLRINAENMRNELSAYMDTVHLDSNSGFFGVLGCWEILANNYLPTLARFK